MFDIGFTELLLVGLVALVVLGPERLPGAVRTTGLWVGRLKRSFSNIKAEVEREIGADEIRRQLHNERILDLEREMKTMKESIMPPSSSSSSDTRPATTEVTKPAPEPAPASNPDRSPEP
ncbi:Sec-independent protein translocase protein TatB [Stutzerimonas nitrititolerans]|uniref:Sec-independent protein translocase protein TatB n=1 Tax=Stutzerimonas nitrititolerans TaxID=2482751 RepID=UPI000EDC46D6|nr:Sec-independent protein translocase protein TatB [Stutzerimonas nitrititolerans]HCL77401.1 twin-arginine translocase subunit TatB [Pseudomonas sp.]